MLTSNTNQQTAADGGAGSEPADDDAQSEPNTKRPLHENPSIRQFIKFCLVGASSFVINFGLFNLLYVRMERTLFVSYTIAFFISVLNGFFWNRRWTFKEKRGRSAKTQYLRFVLVNLVGLVLNNGIAVSVISYFTSDGRGFGSPSHVNQVLYNCLSGSAKHHYPALLTNGALLTATCFVVFWNYFANKHWTFKH